MFGDVLKGLLYFLVVVIIPYLLGSVSTSIIVTKLFLKKDIRDFGSGNAGTTNVLRSVGKMPALITLLGDILKTALGVAFTYFVLGDVHEVLRTLSCYVAGFSCFCGHVYPVYYGFKGGKGVLVSATMILIIDWKSFLVVFGVFLIATIITKWVSLGSVLAAVTYPIITWFIYEEKAASDLKIWSFLFENQRIIVTCIAAVFGLLVIFKHRANIKRLIDGTEGKLSFKKGGK